MDSQLPGTYYRLHLGKQRSKSEGHTQTQGTPIRWGSIAMFGYPTRINKSYVLDINVCCRRCTITSKNNPGNKMHLRQRPPCLFFPESLSQFPKAVCTMRHSFEHIPTSHTEAIPCVRLTNGALRKSEVCHQDNFMLAHLRVCLKGVFMQNFFVLFLALLK